MSDFGEVIEAAIEAEVIRRVRIVGKKELVRTISEVGPRYVLIPRFVALTGYSEKAVYRKIEEGVWLQGEVYRKGTDGHILMDLWGYDRWAEGAEAPGSKSGPATSESASPGKRPAAEKRSSAPPPRPTSNSPSA